MLLRVLVVLLAVPAVAQPKSKAAIDTLFRSWAVKLPEAATLSEQNGMSLIECDGKPGATYTLLEATAAKVKVTSDAELISLVPWAKHHNACLRHIAIEVIINRIGFDRNSLSAPGMHEVEDHHFHDIMVSLKRFLDEKKVAIPAGTFEGMFVSLSQPEATALLRGAWVEHSEGKGVQDIVTFTGETIAVTTKNLPTDAKHPDHTWTTMVDRVTVNDRAQVAVTGLWNVESNGAGWKGEKVQPSQFVYTFWPVAPGVVWFKNGASAYWELLRKAP